VAPPPAQLDHPAIIIHMNEAQLIDFLQTQQLCVIATLGSEGQPQAATAAFSQTDRLELMIGTSATSRKCANIARDPRVAVTVTDPERRLTLQYEGRARRLEGEELAARQKGHYAKLPELLPLKDLPDQAFFTIEPVFIKFSDVSTWPWRVVEISI
jgi:uncharacterized protein YhbP (UPF0306 family)